MDFRRKRREAARSLNFPAPSSKKACLDRWPVSEHGSDAARLRELERVQPLAKRGFSRRLPARVDGKPVPEPRRRREAVALEPFAKRRNIFGRGLDVAQGS